MRVSRKPSIHAFLSAATRASLSSHRRPFRRGNVSLRLEFLEPRQLLSVTAQELMGPMDEEGAQWTYDLDPGDSSGGSNIETLTSPGVSSNGKINIAVHNDVTSVDTSTDPVTVTHDSGDAIAVYGFNSSGFVAYEFRPAHAVNQDNAVDFSPFSIILPTVMDVGPTYSSDFTQTVVDSDGKVHDTHVHLDIRLITPTASITITAMNQPFNCYQVQTTETDTPDGQAPQSPDTFYTYYSPGVGTIAEADDASAPDTYTTILTNYKNAFSLAFVNQPKSTAVKGKMPLQVEILNNGAVATKSKKDITLTLLPSGGALGTLAGTTSVKTVGGIANFNNLSIDKAGTYTLQASDGTHFVNSDPFKIVAGQLVFITSPSPIKPGKVDQVFTPPIEVALKDGDGKIVTSEDGQLVGLNFLPTNPGTPNASGTTATLVHGIATFSSLKVDKPDVYTLKAVEADMVPGESKPFTVKGNHLEFSIKPADTGFGEAVVFTVTLKDASGKIVTAHDGDLVNIQINPAGNSPAANIGSIGNGVLEPLVGGSASYTASNGFSIKSIGTYTFHVTELTAAQAAVNTTDDLDSGPITVKANHLVFKVRPPATVGVNDPLNMQVQLVDFKNRVITNDSSDIVHLQLNVLKGTSANNLTGTTDITLVNGVADFTGGAALTFSSTGTYTFTAVLQDGTHAPIQTAATATTGHLSVKSRKLAFHVAPRSFKNAGGSSNIIVWLENWKGTPITTESTNQIQIVLEKVVGKNTTVVSTTHVTFVNGAASFTASAFAATGSYLYEIEEVQPDATVIDSTLGLASKVFKVT